MNRSLKLSMLVALALGTAQAMAVDLGQVQVKSALGQPLLAEIPLHPANPAELRSLTVQLASSEAFARAGVVGGRPTIPLQLSVTDAGGGHPVIRITSTTPVSNPYLDLLIEVKGNAGKSVREFAILLDPPHAPSAAPVVSAPQAMPAAPATPAPVVAQRAAATPKAVAATGDGTYGPVERGQTLSGIASSTAPTGVDVQQMMLALQQANPDAFYQDNINALKSGVVLRIPTAADAQALTMAAALAEVRRQNGDWRARTPAQPSVVADAATRASTSSTPDNTRSDDNDRLALVSAADRPDAGGHGTQGAAQADASASAIRQDLLRTRESVASLKQQGAELKSRLKDLSDINQKNEHLLSLKDNEIAELQRKLAAARKGANTTEPAVADNADQTSAEPVSAAAKPADQLQTASASTTLEPALTPVPASSNADAQGAPVATTSVPAHAAPVPAVAQSKPVKPAGAATAAIVDKAAATSAPVPAVTERPWYEKTWAWAAGAGVIVLLILLALLGRRRKPGASAKSGSSLADRFGATAATDPALSDIEDLDQEELLDQLAEHPDDVGLHLELVTLYYSRRDVEHFEAAAEAMYAHVSDPQQDEWQDVLHMGEDLVPGHPLFDHHAELPVNEEAEARREFDIDDYADDADAPTVVSSMPPLPPGEGKASGGYSFDFDLTPRSADTQPPAHDAPGHDDETVVAPLPHEASDEGMPTESESAWQQADSIAQPDDATSAELGEFNDDPIDTKLDLARAYLDMGDLDGARAMLGEVVKEGNQMQRETAKQLLDGAR